MATSSRLEEIAFELRQMAKAMRDDQTIEEKYKKVGCACPKCGFERVCRPNNEKEG